MSRVVHESWEGPIPGLRLPENAWRALRRENIKTLGRLQAVADQIERIVPGIGTKTAAVIRAELARLKSNPEPKKL